jgi:hypothetical protein
MPILFSIQEKFNPTAANVIFGQAINHRLNTEGLNIPELAAVAAKRGLSLQDVMAWPE